MPAALRYLAAIGAAPALVLATRVVDPMTLAVALAVAVIGTAALCLRVATAGEGTALPEQFRPSQLPSRHVRDGARPEASGVLGRREEHRSALR
ncbi:MAG: hypothetical protein V2J02_01625 [Pseudomonadales bacterium]|nr:hypothetical protein [Pseudomonadales bacterium]